MKDIRNAELALAHGVTFAPLESSATSARYLAILPDGRQYQLTEKLYVLLDCLVRPQTIGELCGEYSKRTGSQVSESDVGQVILQIVYPKGLVRVGGLNNNVQAASPTQANSVKRDESILALRIYKDIFSTRLLYPITRVLSHLFRTPIAVVLLIITAIAHALTYSVLGSIQVSDASLSSPFVLSTLFLCSIFCHELGHLSACRRWGIAHGSIGVGVYFLSPVLYADVSNAWRLSQRQRVGVDLGGFYFQLLFCILLFIGFAMTGNRQLLLVISLIDAAIIFNLNPLMKLDGYWILSDATGIPNLHKRATEFLSHSLERLKPIGFNRGKSYNPSLPFQDLSHHAHRSMVVYVFLSITCWPLLIIVALPSVARLVLTFPDMVQTALVEIATAIESHSFSALALHIADLVIAVVLIANVALLLFKSSQALVARMRLSQLSKETRL